MVTFRQRDMVLALLAGGVALAEIAKRARVPRRMVLRIGKAANLLPPPEPPKARPRKEFKPPIPPRPPKRPPQPPQPEPRRHGVAAWQYSVALAVLRSGATCVEAAAHAGIGEKTAAKIARAHSLRVRPRGRQKGEAGVPLPLRAAALRMVAEGATLKAAGAALGVTKQAVHAWAKAEGVKVGKGRKRKAKAAVREPVKPAQRGSKTVVVRGVTLAKMAEMT
ncbi:hypothetical protein AMST5_01874 [freshwater sediment metagenome]|uniref:Uncharacterized protein n=1 Tax=freshwater sediment metagenome TaxID=556182 RepID=A0AA48M0W0_9ZZZZ